MTEPISGKEAGAQLRKVLKRLAIPKGLLTVGVPTSYTASLAQYVEREMHSAEAAHLQIYDEAPATLTLRHYGVDIKDYGRLKPIVEMGHDGRPLPRHKRNVRNKVNSNRNKKRKKR